MHEGAQPLLKRAHLMKVDLTAVPAQESWQSMWWHCTGFRLFWWPGKQLARCQALGFACYQGYCFAWPKLVAGRGMAEDRLSVLQRLAICTNRSPSCLRCRLSFRAAYP